MKGIPSVEESYGTEFIRKGIHLFSLLIPVVYYFVTKQTALTILIPLTLLFGLSDFARLRIPAVGFWYDRLFGFLLRNHERPEKGGKLNGATYVLLAATIVICIFPKIIVITSFAILIISDTSAALIGRRFGKRRFLTKTLEGAAAFFVSALIVVALAPKVEYLPMEYVIGVLAAAFGAVVESSSLRLDDNLSIPLSVGGAMWVMYMWFLPTVNLLKLDQIT